MMLRITLAIVLYLLSCLFRSTHASRLVTKDSPEYGVGFNLALDYATASILYADGTAIDAAKVEGDEMYKQVVRRAIQDKEISTSLAEMPMPVLQPIVTAELDATEAFLPILQSLKHQTEKNINTSITEVYITISSPMDDPSLIAIRSACHFFGMEPTRVSIPAFQSAIRSYNITSHCPSHKAWLEPAAEGSDDPERLLLFVEYTRAGLIAILATEECGFSMEERELRNQTLGSMGSWESKPQDIEDAIKKITQPPFETGSSLWVSDGHDMRTRNDIQEVMLTGEDASDGTLLSALEDVFGEHWQVLKQGHDERAEQIDPVFVAARGAAIRAFEDLEWFIMDDVFGMTDLAKENGE